MVPFGPIWSHMVPDGPIRAAPYGPLWSHMAPDGPGRPRMVPYGFIWSYMASYRPIWLQMVPLGTIWFHMVPYDPRWDQMAQMAPYGSYGPMWPHMVPYGPRWSLLLAQRLRTYVNPGVKRYVDILSRGVPGKGSGNRPPAGHESNGHVDDAKRLCSSWSLPGRLSMYSTRSSSFLISQSLCTPERGCSGGKSAASAG